MKFCDAALVEKPYYFSRGNQLRDMVKKQLEKDRRSTRAALSQDEESTNFPKIDKRQGNRGAAT